MSRDIAAIFADIDAFDPDKFVAHLTPDAKFRFANADPVTGRAAVKEAVAGFFSTIDGLTHHILNVYESGETVDRADRRGIPSARTASRSPCPTPTSSSSTATWCATGRSTSTSLPSSPEPEQVR